MSEQLTQGGRCLKRGETHYPEDWRMSHRLAVARAILRAQGVAPSYPTHATNCERHPDRLRNVLADWRGRVACTCGIGIDPEPTWPEWADDAVFNAAFRLADLIQTKRGQQHRAEAAAAKRAEASG